METSSFPFPATLPASLAFFTAVYLAGYFLIFRTWKPTLRYEATSCFVSLFHGIPAVVMASHALLSTTHAAASSANTVAEISVLDFSMAYFTVDLLHYLFFIPNDAVLFILHHLATLYVFTTCRFVVGHGGHTLLVLLVLAEATSPCQNVWSLAGYRRNEVILARKVREVLSPAFYVSYTVARGFAGPVVLYDMAAFYGGTADGSVPRWAWLSWLVVIAVAVLVSVLWVWGHWSDWFRERKLLNSTHQKDI